MKTNAILTPALAGLVLMLGASVATAGDDALDGLSELGVLPSDVIAMSDPERRDTRGAVRAGLTKKCIWWKACVYVPYFRYDEVKISTPGGYRYVTRKGL